jgi:hypothetical protein
MRTFVVLVVLLIGCALILTRHLYAQFLLSFVSGSSSVQRRERSLLRWIAIGALIGGVGFVVLGLLMALDLVFRW